MAEKVAEDVGAVMTVVDGDPSTILFIFEERHDSRLGQVEIAIMLNRLYEDYNLRHIGLEGQPASAGPLDLSWAHVEPFYEAGQLITGREDVIVQTLEDGEISSAEAIGLIYNDAVIDGIDDADLYNFETTAAAYNAPQAYLVSIAWTGMTDVERSASQALYDAGKYAEFFDFTIATDDYTAETWAVLNDIIEIASAEEWLEILDGLQQKAVEVNAPVTSEDESNLADLREYIEHVAQRSEVMAANMLALAEAYPGAPLAMTVGALHTTRLVELFSLAGASVVVLRALSLAEDNRAGLLSVEAYNRKTAGQSVDPDGWLGSFLDGRKKPPPVSEGEPYKMGYFLRQIAQNLANLAASEWAKSPDSSEEDILKGLQAILDSSLTYWKPDGIERILVENVGADPSGVYVSFKVEFRDGTFLFGTARLIPGKSKEQVTLGPRMDISRYNLLMQQSEFPIPAPPSTSAPVPQPVCSDTVVEWSQSGG
ncbi:MAG: hypothetical protein AB1531_03430 [Chloroflexota bacterium]